MELLDEERKLLEYVNDVDHDIEGVSLSPSLSLSLSLSLSGRADGLNLPFPPTEYVKSLDGLNLPFPPTEYVKSLEAIVSQKVERLSNFKGEAGN